MQNKRTFIITGAGSGMGRATAKLMAENPDNQLILIGRNAGALEETRSMMKGTHIVAPMDIRDKAAWQNMFKQHQSINLCGVFANAGLGGENHYGEDDRWDEIISINLTGTYVTIQESLPYLRNSRDTFKNIVITSSCLARFGVPNYTAYCTAKTGLLGLTRSLAVQLASEQILVNAICPGWVETEMAKAGIQKLADRSGKSYEESFKEQMSFVPLNRIGQPEEIAAFVRFLFMNEQTSITGQGLDINNGSFMI